MGGDGAASITVPAAIALAPHADIVLFGATDALLAADPNVASVCAIEHAPSSIQADDSLRRVLRHRTDSSMYMALQALQQGAVDGVVSGGDTRALMGLSRHLLGMVEGVDRPAIAKEIQGVNQTFWMADLGANVQCSTGQMLQIVRMGRLAAEHLSDRLEPRVALLNIGTERFKGTGELAPVYSELQATLGSQFVGYVEGSQLFDNNADVVVCDGYAGNITLKAIEGTAAMATHMLRTRLGNATGLQRLALLALRPLFTKLRGELDTQQYNGAAFLGLDGVVIKSHGNATVPGYCSAIRRTITAVKEDLPQLLKLHLTQGSISAS